ncbi:MAG: cell wall hydrolase [Sphingobium sp.]|nr:cell wall hydrolase [Sphingobium sp.]
MKYNVRLAALAALFGIPAMIAAGAPGLALELDKPLPLAQQPMTSAPILPQAPAANAPSKAEVDETPSIDIVDEAPVEPRVSLAALVAAQAMPAAPDDALRCLASAIFHEAKGEPMTGQLAVAHVILNRAQSGRFPASVCGVVAQRGQFSFVRGGIIPSPALHNASYRTAMAIAQIAVEKAWVNPVSGALFFHATHVSPNWGKRRVAAIGHHIFYR